MNKKEVIILLTACISPKGMVCTEIQDSGVRLKQYLDALEFYLNKTNYKIVFCENSAYDLSRVLDMSIYKDRLEVISYLDDSDKKLGKGYSEAIIIHEAIEKSLFIKECTYIVKITGRLIIENIHELISEVFFLYKNKRIVASNLSYKKNLPYTHFFISHKHFFDAVFFDEMTKVNDTKLIYFEHIFYDRVLDWLSRGNIYHVFLRFIEVKGKSGSTGIDYKKVNCYYKLRTFLKGSLMNARIKFGLLNNFSK